MVKNLPAMPEIWSLVPEDPLEEGTATHSSSILVWTIPWMEKPGGLQPTGFQESNMTEQLIHTQLYTSSEMEHSDLKVNGFSQKWKEQTNEY